MDASTEAGRDGSAKRLGNANETHSTGLVFHRVSGCTATLRQGKASLSSILSDAHTATVLSFACVMSLRLSNSASVPLRLSKVMQRISQQLGNHTCTAPSCLHLAGFLCIVSFVSCALLMSKICSSLLAALRSLCTAACSAVQLYLRSVLLEHHFDCLSLCVTQVAGLAYLKHPVSLSPLYGPLLPSSIPFGSLAEWLLFARCCISPHVGGLLACSLELASK